MNWYEDIDLNNRSLDLVNTLRDANKIFDLFYENKFQEAYSRSEEYSGITMMHTHAKAFIAFLYALLTLEKDEITRGKRDIEESLQFVNKHRKSKSIVESVTGLFWRADTCKYTDEELHAELIHGECNVMLALLTFFDEQSVMAIMKGALRMVTANQCFKFCHASLTDDKNWTSEEVKMQFESGVLNGFGIFNLVLSMIPKKIMRLLSIAGFSGDKEIGLECIERSTQLTSGVRCRVSVLTIQGFAMYFEQLVGVDEIDPKWMRSMIDFWGQRFPKAVFVLFFLAKYHLMRGDTQTALKEYNECIALQDEWISVHKICQWDLVWSYTTLFDWNNAIKAAKYLAETSAYSPATNYYQMAVFKMMQMEEKKNENLRAEVDELMKSVPTLKQRFAGRTIPQEKFLCTRAQQYFDEKRKDALIALMELFYTWNYMCLLKTKELANPFLQRIDDKMKSFEDQDVKFEQYAFLRLVKGVIFRNLNKDSEAVKCFQELINTGNKITKDTFIVPHAVLELGITYLKMYKYEESRNCLEKVKNDDFNKYLNESIVNLRVASALRILQNTEDTITHL